MNALREQSTYDGNVPTIVSNNANFIRAASGRSRWTISFEDAQTMFHEFGHALHGLNSAVAYPTLSGTNTVRDFVEFPEPAQRELVRPRPKCRRCWSTAPVEPLPQALVDKIKRADTFNAAFGVVEAQASAIVDLELHLAGSTPIEPQRL